MLILYLISSDIVTGLAGIRIFLRDIYAIGYLTKKQSTMGNWNISSRELYVEKEKAKT